MHDISVLCYIFFPFNSEFPGFFHALFTAEVNEIVVFYHFGADKAFFKVGVDHSGALGGLRSAQECPCPHLIGTRSEEGLQVKQGVCGPDQTRDSGFLQPDFIEEFLAFLKGV